MPTVFNDYKSKIAKLLRNKTMLGIIAGLISGIIKDIIDLITYSLKITDNLFGYLASGIFSEPQSARSTIGLIIGYLADLVMGGFLGFIFVYFIKRTEPEYILSKSIGFGVLLWILVLGTVGAFKITTLPAKTPATVLVMFYTCFLWFSHWIDSKKIRKSGF